MIERKLCSSAFLAQTFQAHPKSIEKRLVAAGYEPAVFIDDVPYWGESAFTYLGCLRFDGKLPQEANG